MTPTAELEATAADASAAKTPPKLTAAAATWHATSPKTSSQQDLADQCEIQISYAIGVAQPISVLVNTFGTGKCTDDQILELVKAKL